MRSAENCKESGWLWYIYFCCRQPSTKKAPLSSQQRWLLARSRDPAAHKNHNLKAFACHVVLVVGMSLTCLFRPVLCKSWRDVWIYKRLALNDTLSLVRTWCWMRLYPLHQCHGHEHCHRSIHMRNRKTMGKVRQVRWWMHLVAEMTRKCSDSDSLCVAGVICQTVVSQGSADPGAKVWSTCFRVLWRKMKKTEEITKRKTAKAYEETKWHDIAQYNIVCKRHHKKDSHDLAAQTIDFYCHSWRTFGHERHSASRNLTSWKRCKNFCKGHFVQQWAAKVFESSLITFSDFGRAVCAFQQSGFGC